MRLKSGADLQLALVWEDGRWYYAAGFGVGLDGFGYLASRRSRSLILRRFLHQLGASGNRLLLATDGNPNALASLVEGLFSIGDLDLVVKQIERITRWTVCSGLSVKKDRGKRVSPSKFVAAVAKRLKIKFAPAEVGIAWAVALWHRMFHGAEYPDPGDSAVDDDDVALVPSAPVSTRRRHRRPRLSLLKAQRPTEGVRPARTPRPE